MHLLLTGQPGVGKSTIIQKTLQTLQIHPCGFLTLAAPPQADGSSTVHLFPTQDANYLSFQIKNRIGLRSVNHVHTAYPETFDTLGVNILAKIHPPCILMDELGFMEQEAHFFQQRVLELLQQNQIPVLGVIKPRSTPFLDQIRALPNIKIIEITPENREEKLPEVIAFMQHQINKNHF